MKILHTSDLHIGSPLTSRLTADKVRERKGELLRTFERMVEEALYQRVRLFIIAGDLFDSERVSKTVAERVLGIIERSAGIDFLYLPGNHEKQAIAESGIPLPQNLRIFGEEWTYFNYDYVTVAGRSNISPNMLGELTLDYAKTNIVVLHGALTDGRCADECIGIRDLCDRHIDYLALGHYHSFSETKIDDTGVAVYSGTPEGRGFDEVGTKGFVMLDTDGKKVKHTFYPFAKRTLRIIDADISRAQRRIDIDSIADSALRGVPSQDIVRLRLVGTRPPELYADLDAITERWKMSFYHMEAKDETTLRIDPEAYRYDRSLKGEFIRLVISKDDLSDSEKDKIIRTGLAALMGDGDGI